MARKSGPEPTLKRRAVAALAFSLWDAENSTKLEHPDDQAVYFARAERILAAIQSLRTQAERSALALEIVAAASKASGHAALMGGST